MKEFEIIQLPIPKEPQKIPYSNSNSPTHTIRMCVDIKNDLAEKIKDYAYWEGLNQQDIILQALENFIEDKSIKSRPLAVKNKSKLGRKRKNN